MNLYVYKKFGSHPGVYTTDRRLIEYLDGAKEKFDLWYTISKPNGMTVGRAFLLKRKARLCDLRNIIRGVKKNIRAKHAR